METGPPADRGNGWSRQGGDAQSLTGRCVNGRGLTGRDPAEEQVLRKEEDFCVLTRIEPTLKTLEMLEWRRKNGIYSVAK